MTSIVGGYDTGLFDSSLFLLNRNDRTREGATGHGEETYVNVANGNLVIQHKDAWLPSQGEDTLLARTYNSRGTWGNKDGKGWSVNAAVIKLSQISGYQITFINADTSRSVFNWEAATNTYISVDGSGAYEVIRYDSATKSYLLTRSDQTVLTFDNNGTLKSSRDTNGNQIDYVFSAGKLQSVRDDQGHVITYVYAGSDLIRVQDETGVVLVRYEYAQGLLTAVTDRAGHRTTYTYYTGGEIASITLPANTGEATRTLTFEYGADATDSTGKTRLLTALTDAEGGRTTFAYTFNIDNFSKYNGGTTRVVTSLGVARRESNAAEFVQWRQVNGYYATWSATQYSGNAAFRAQADAITAAHTVRYDYDKNGAITSVVDQAGYQTTYQYDAKENLTASIDANGYAATRSNDAYWRNLRRDYGIVDVAGQGKLVAQLTAAEITALLERYTTRFEYDTRGNLTKKTDNAKNVTTFTYTAFNKLATQTAAMGYALTSSDDIVYQDKRAELGYARLVANLSVANRTAILALYTTSFTYDAKQNVTEIKSPGGDLTRFQYDSFGNLTRRTVFLDAADLVTVSKQQVTQYFYDAYGQNVRTVDAEGNESRKTFDHFGNLLSQTDARGGITAYAYDNDDRVVSVTDAEGFVTVNSYDAVGNRVSMRDANGHTVLYVYDRNNMLVATIDPKDGNATGNRTTSYAYDVTGNRTRITDAEGRISTYTYRADNRLLEVRTPAVANAAGTGTASYTSRYEYDGLGNRIAVTDFNGNRSEFVFDQTNLLKRTTDAIGNVTEYRYDANLNQIQLVIGAQLAADKRRVLRFSFDEEDQRIAETDALGGQTRYSRDAVGNVVATTDANGHATDYRFDRNNRRVAEVRPAVTDPATGASARHTVTHQFDGNGNRIATTDENGKTTRMSYDRDNRLVLLEDANGIKTVFGYDSRHNRTSVQIGVQARMDASNHVVIDGTADAQVQTFAYDEFNQLVAKTDGVGNALATSDAALYQPMRAQMGYAASAAALTDANRQALRAAYTERYSFDKVGNLLTATDAQGRVTQMTYDGLNRETQRTDALGQVWRQRFDGNGNRVALVDALGRQTTLAYDAVDRLVSQTNALGVVTKNDYDHVGNLLASSEAFGSADARTVRFDYDLNNRATKRTDAQGNVQAYEYDAVGNRLRMVDGRGNATRYVYDARDRLVKSIDPLNLETKVEYDGVGNRIALVDARGGITRLAYDPGNRLLQSTDAEGRISRFEYDVRGNRITQRTASGTADEQVTRFEYDAQNNLRAVVDAAGGRSTSDFDRVYNQTAATDANGHTTRYGFDALNRRINMTDALGQTSSVGYDAVGNVLTQTDALGRITTTSYDADNRAISMTAADGTVTRYAYDAVDNRIAMTRAFGSADAQTTTYAYDRNNRLLSQTDALGHANTFEYDANGNAVAQTDALGHRTSYVYDADNRVERIIDALGQVTQYRYDANANRVQVIDARGNASTSYFNADNELTLSVNAEGEATSYSYDANGNVIASTRHAQRLATPANPAVKPAPAADARDQITRLAYDKLNRLVQRTDGEGFVSRFAYDAVGNLTATTQFLDLAQTRSEVTRTWYDAIDRAVTQLSAEGYVTNMAYDAVSNVTARTQRSERYSAPANGAPVVAQATDTGVMTRFAYDAMNRLVRETDALGTFTDSTWNARGERTASIRAAGTADARRADYRYDAAGRLTDEINANGVVTRLDLDADGQVIARHEAFGTADVHTTRFEYDAIHRLVRQTNADGVVTVLSYDATGNLRSRSLGAGLAGVRTETFEYDRNNRITARLSPLGERTAYAYDGTGNRAQMTDALGRITDYAFDRNNRLLTETLPSVPQGAAFVRHTVTHQYDGAGNRIATTDENGRTSRFAFDRENRLAMATDANGLQTVYGYDARNNLVSAAVGATAHTDAAGAVVIDSLADAQLQTFAYDAIDRRVATTDGVGNALATSDATLYRAMRVQMGYAASAAALSAADQQALRNAYTERSAYDRVGNEISLTDAQGRVTNAAFDKLDRQTSRTDAAGGTSTWAYDAHNRVVAETDQLGRTVTSAYDKMDRLVTSTNALGVVTKNDYDHVGNLLASSEAFGSADARTVRFDYDLNNRATKRTDAQGNVQAYEYDAVGNRLRMVDGRGNATRYVYDARDRLVKSIDPLNLETKVEYDGVGNRIALVDARGGITRLAYDPGNRLLQSTDAEGRISRFEYDVRGNRITQRTASGTADEQVTRFEYDAQNNLRAVVDAAGGRSTSDFDRVYNQTAATDANGHTTRYGFDALNRRINMTDALGQTSSVGYDAVGNVLTQTDALGRITTTSYDADNRAISMTAADGTVTRYAYDAVDNRIAMTRAFGSADAQTTTYAYDRNNRLLSQTDALGHANTFEYDANGNAVAQTDALGHRTSYVYDADNRVERIIDALGQVTQYRYDANANRVQVIDARGNASTSYFNADNELTLAVNAEGEATSYSYDANGNVIASTRHAQRLATPANPAVKPAPAADARDQVTRYAFDKLNRAVRMVDAEGFRTDTGYDAVGNVLTTTAYADRTSLSAATVANAKNRVTQFSYDALDRQTQRIDAEGYTTRFAYDAVGNRTEQIRFAATNDFTTPALQARTTWTYDALNRLTSETSPIGVQTRMRYDARGNRTEQIDAFGSADARSTRFAFDAADRLASRTDALGTVTTFGYDNANRLTAEVRATGTAEQRTLIHGYDNANRRTTETLADGSLRRTEYDALGNVTATVDAAGSTAERRSTATYDRANRVLTSTLGAGTPEALVTSFTYDAFGNRTREAVADGTADARLTQHVFDHLDRLIASTDGNGIVTVNDYDAFGNRVLTSILGKTRSAGGVEIERTEAMRFEYDGRNLVIAQRDGESNVIAREYDGLGHLRFQTTGAGSTAASRTEFRYDASGRLLAKVIDPAATGLKITTAYGYDARGNLVTQTNADGGVSTTRFDALDRAIVTTDAEGFSVSFGYDRFGNQTSITTGQYLVAAGSAGYDAAKAARAFVATTLLAYDAMDRKTLQADALGTVTRYSYDLRGNRTGQTEGFGHLAAGAALTNANVTAYGTGVQRISSFTFDAADRLVQERQPIGTVIRHEYTAAGEKSAKIVDAGQGAQFRNATTRWFYDAGGRMTFEADPVGTVTQTVYDDFGNQVRQLRGLALDSNGRPSTAATPDLRITAFEYDAAHRLTAQVIDPQGLALRTAYEYDTRNNQTAVIDGNGRRTEMRHDAADRAVWLRDGAGFVTSVAYNGRGLVTAQTRHATAIAGAPAGTLPPANAADRRSTQSFDAAGRVLDSTDARGVVTRTTYDAIGNVTQVLENATAQHGSPAHATRYEYDLANQRKTQTDASGLVTRFEYDALYNLTQQTVENRFIDTLNGNVARLELQTTTWKHDLNNRVTDQIVDPSGLNLHTAWRYDSLGNRVAEVSANGFAAAESNADWAQAARRDLGLPADASQLTAAQHQRVLDAYSTRTWFDAASRAVLTVDQNGFAKSAQYDAVGNLVRSTVHATALDLAQIAQLDALHAPAVAAANEDRVTDRVFDKADRVTVERGAAARQQVNGVFIDGHRAEVKSVYDAVGNVVRRIDGNGNTSYQYFDGANRLAGRLDAAGYLTLLTNDAFGNVTQERLLLDAPALSASQKESLDLATYAPAGAARIISHEFDAANHETRTVYPSSDLFDGTHASAPLQVLRTFDAFGSALSQTVMHRVGEANAPAQLFKYDAAGRLFSKTDARADELLHSNAPEIVALRKDLGYTNADGSGKLAAQLTTADIAAITAAHNCAYTYDSVGNVREQTEAGRITTFAYDKANRTSAVHYPATERVEVDANGVVTTTNDRAQAIRAYDANGNAIFEAKPDGEQIAYRFDRANRQVGALNDGVYIQYGFNFAGDVTRMHRHFAVATSVFTPPPAHAQDQIIDIAVDGLGRKIAEAQLGDNTTSDDDRIVHYGYDANGNQVQTTDARGNVSTIVYDGLNRMVGSVNREGGVTQTSYDAQGNAVSRQTGGYTAPSLRGNLRIDRVSDSGAVIEWSTDRAADGSVFVRPAGSNGAWQEFTSATGFALDHSVVLSGLTAQTDYEYYIVSNDSFGFSLSSQAQPNTLRTAVGLGEVSVDGVRQVGQRFEARVQFQVPAGATNVRVLVGSGDAGDIELGDTTAFAATSANGAYSASLDYASADALFQVEWTDADGVHRSGATVIRQQQDLRKLDLDLKTEVNATNSSIFNLTAGWNLADLLAANEIESVASGYSVFIGLTSQSSQPPQYVQATLVDGRFTAQFTNLREGARTLFLQYVRADGSVVDGAPVTINALAGLNSRVQSLEFDFPDTNTNGTTLAVRTRIAGSSTWTDLPAGAINGSSSTFRANVAGLPAGGYEYEATLVKGGQTLRRTSGSFTLREPTSLNNLTDATNPGNVQHTLTDSALTLQSLLPIAADETLTVTLKDAQGADVAHTFTAATATLDLAALHPGSYTLRAVKTRTTSSTTGTPPVTTTTTTTLNDLGATVTVGPLTLTDAQAQGLEGTRNLAAYALSATRSQALQITTGGTSSADHSWNLFDANGRRIFSNESGGVWIRTFHDAQGNITKEVRFQRRDGNGAFIDRISDDANAPSLATLLADYDAAVAASPDQVRVTTRTWDADGHQLTETEHSAAHGAVTHRMAHDRFGNKLVDVSAEGIAGLQNAMRMRYDAANRVIGTESGAFAHYDQAGNVITSSATQTYTYDGRGNQSTAADARGFTTRMHYDAFNRLATRWDGQKAGQASTQRTVHAYDAFDRLVSMTAHDLTGRAAQTSQTTRYSWTNFDQLASYTDALQHSTTRTYDQNGNQTSERDANGHTETFKYSAENRLIQRTDRLGSTSLTEWDAYGQRISETDANGRVTRYQVGAFGQITGMRMSFAAGYGALKGAASSSETMRQDWLGRLVESTDSFGKHLTYGYNDADEQTRISDLALGKQADYGYDALGRRTHESLSKGGLVQREQTNSYNNQGWLTGVSAQAGYDAGGGAAINQGLQVGYGFDADGNRVRIRAEDGSQAIYSYDANGRMLQGRDDKVGDKPDQIVSALQYDGYGNRISETRAAATTTYTYDAANRVVASSAGETFAYDANGNTTEQRVKSEDGHLLRTVTTYNAENRATRSDSADKDGKHTISKNTYDAVGNVVDTRIDGDGYGFNEVTQRDVRYLEQRKDVRNSFAKGAKGLSGATTFSYDANGNLVYLDRGKNQQTKERSEAVFEYDLEGHIIGRADKAGALAGTSGGAEFFQGYEADPDAPGVADWSEYGPPAGSLGPSVMDGLREQYAGSGAQVQSYLYANNKQLAQAQGTQAVELVKLTLSGAVPITVTTSSGGGSSSGVGEGGNAEPVIVETVVGWRLTLAEGDLVRDGAGQIDRAATARRIAQVHYANFSTLSQAGQAKVVAYVQSRLPATIAAGTTVELHGFIVLADGGMSGVTQITDYSVKRIGVDGMPAGSIQSHVVRAGDTLQSISQIYFGSPSYWYLIADANGLQGHEALQEGTTITIPNKVVNAANSADTFKVYNESEIIGSTSPEIRTIKKKKKWYQKLVMILIVVIMIVAIVMTAGAALAAAGPAGATMLASLGAVGAAGASVAATVGAAIGVSGLALAAVSGALIMAAANVLTQGLSIAAKMQDGFEWKQVTKAAGKGAISGAAAFVAAGVADWAKTAELGAWAQAGVRVGTEAVVQVAENGKISNVAGLMLAALPVSSSNGFLQKVIDNKKAVGLGLRILETRVRGNDDGMTWVAIAGQALGAAAGTYKGVDVGRAFTAIGQTAVAYDKFGSQAAWDVALNQVGSYIGSAVTPEASLRSGVQAAMDQMSAPRPSAGMPPAGATPLRPRELTEQDHRNQYGQDGTGDVLSNHNGERLNMPVEPSAPTPEQSRDALRQMDRGASVAGNGYKAKAGDSISKIIGTSNPQAIGNFMRANNLTNDRIDIGRNYFVPEDRTAYGDASALGQATLDVGNVRRDVQYAQQSDAITARRADDSADLQFGKDIAARDATEIAEHAEWMNRTRGPMAEARAIKPGVWEQVWGDPNVQHVVNHTGTGQFVVKPLMSLLGLGSALVTDDSYDINRLRNLNPVEVRDARIDLTIGIGTALIPGAGEAAMVARSESASARTTVSALKEGSGGVAALEATTSAQSSLAAQRGVGSGLSVEAVGSSKVGVPAMRSSNPLSPVLEFDAYGNEIFYRTMSPKDIAKMERTNKIPATGETFISPSEAYASGYEGVTVRVTTRPGTMQQLADVGVSANPGTTALFPDMPSAAKGWTSNNAMFKLEGDVVNTGLGKGKALDIFNSNIVQYESIVRRPH
jgi:YD repeat-containing protein